MSARDAAGAPFHQAAVEVEIRADRFDAAESRLILLCQGRPLLPNAAEMGWAVDDGGLPEE